MSTAGQPAELPPKVKEELQTLYLRIAPKESARRMWDRLLTPAERRRLGNDFDAAFRTHKTVRMWMRARGVSQIRAIIEVAQGIGFLSETNAEWLLRETGEKQPRRRRDKRPIWDSETGTLRIAGTIARSVRVTANPSNIQSILDAFENQGWAKRIDNPIDCSDDDQRLYQALRSLNSGLKKLRFHAQEGGKAVTWALS